MEATYYVILETLEEVENWKDYKPQYLYGYIANSDVKIEAGRCFLKMGFDSFNEALGYLVKEQSSKDYTVI